MHLPDPFGQILLKSCSLCGGRPKSTVSAINKYDRRTYRTTRRALAVTRVTAWDNRPNGQDFRGPAFTPLDRGRARRDKAGHENGTLHSPEHYSLAHALAWPFSSPKIPG